MIARLRLHRRLVKDDRFAETRTPSIDQCPRFPEGFNVLSDASRRLLQSEQPTSTTAGSTNPRSALADTARPACAGPMGLRPHPPHRPQDPGDAGGFHPRPTLAGLTKAFTRHQPRFHESGAGELSPSSASRFSGPCGTRCLRCPRAMRAHESFAPTRSARTPHVTTPSRHRLEADDENDAVARAFALAKRRGLAGPRTSRSRGPLAASFPPAHLSMGRTGGAGEPIRHAVTIHSRGSDSTVRHGWKHGPLAQPGLPGPRVASPVAPRRAAGSAAPEVPSIDEPPVRNVRLAPGAATLAGCYPQVVTNLWIALDALFTSAGFPGRTGPPGLTT